MPSEPTAAEDAVELRAISDYCDEYGFGVTADDLRAIADRLESRDRAAAAEDDGYKRGVATLEWVADHWEESKGGDKIPQIIRAFVRRLESRDRAAAADRAIAEAARNPDFVADVRDSLNSAETIIKLFRERRNEDAPEATRKAVAIRAFLAALDAAETTTEGEGE